MDGRINGFASYLEPTVGIRHHDDLGDYQGVAEHGGIVPIFNVEFVQQTHGVSRKTARKRKQDTVKSRSIFYSRVRRELGFGQALLRSTRGLEFGRLSWSA
jgi:hypothetical protein